MKDARSVYEALSSQMIVECFAAELAHQRYVEARNAVDPEKDGGIVDRGSPFGVICYKLQHLQTVVDRRLSNIVCGRPEGDGYIHVTLLLDSDGSPKRPSTEMVYNAMTDYALLRIILKSLKEIRSQYEHQTWFSQDLLANFGLDFYPSNVGNEDPTSH